MGIDAIAFPPKERDGGQGTELFRAVEHVPMLPAPVDHVPHAPREGARGTRGRVHRREAGNLVVLIGASRCVQGKAGSARHERLAEMLDDDGDRREA